MLYVKAIHIIFVITWFAGLFYIVRLFIYDTEAQERPENERQILQDQFRAMERRLWNVITAPSMILTIVSGLWLAFELGYLASGWMHLKLGFVGLLLIYHFICLRILRQLQKGAVRYSSTRLRVWNELATILLVGIVFIVVLRSSISLIYGLVGFVLLTLLMMSAIKIYKRIREKSEKPNTEDSAAGNR